MSQGKIYSRLFFEGKTIAGPTYLEMLQNWLFIFLKEDLNNFIFEKMNNLPIGIFEFRTHLNENVPQRWISK